MGFPEINHSLSIELTIPQALAFRYLERHGLKYLVDFGYGNAIEKARALAKEHPKNRDVLFTPASPPANL